MDREAWRAGIHGVAKSWTRQRDWTELNWSSFFSPSQMLLPTVGWMVTTAAPHQDMSKSQLLLPVKSERSRSVSRSVMSDSLCSLQASSIHGILQARIPVWVAMPFSRGSSQPRDQTQVSCIAGRFFTIWATREAREYDLIWTFVDLCRPGRGDHAKLGQQRLEWCFYSSSHQKLEEVRKDPLLYPCERGAVLQIAWVRTLVSGIVRKYISVVLSYRVCGHLW